MKVLKSWLQDYIEEILPDDEKIIQALTLKSCEVDGYQKIETIGKDGKKIDDTVFDIKVLPDRAHYMLCHRGVAYDLCAVMDLKFKLQENNLPKIVPSQSKNIEASVCNRYSEVGIKNIKNGESPLWLKSRLESIGSRSISTIVDITNYDMFDTGQPIHAFDTDKLTSKITVRYAKENEQIEILGGKIINLKSHHVVLSDDAGALDIAGIKGGKRAEVDINTKNITLISSNFSPTYIRKTSIELGIRNDSSKRYENEITPHITEKGISKFIEISKFVFGDIDIVSYRDIYNSLPSKWTVEVSHKNVDSVLGYSISEKRITEILEKLECEVKVNNSIFTITPPFERLDLIIPEDVIDEIGRIEGLDKVKSIVPNFKNNDLPSKEFILIEKIKNILVDNGFNEIITRSFTDKGDVEVSYPMASDKKFLRTTLSTNVLNSLDLAVKNSPLLGLDEIRIFEIGKVFDKNGEHTSLFASIKNINKKSEKEKEKIKMVRDGLLKELELDTQILCTVDDTGGIISLGGKHIGKTNHMDGSMEINLDLVLENIKTSLDISSIDIKKGSRKQFLPFSLYPFIARDIAMFVPTDITEDNVKVIISDTLKRHAEELVVKGPDLFDMFEKNGKKSIAFRIIFQAIDRTLSDEEINSLMEKLYITVKEKGWEVR